MCTFLTVYCMHVLLYNVAHTISDIIQHERHTRDLHTLDSHLIYLFVCFLAPFQHFSTFLIVNKNLKITNYFMKYAGS